MSSKNGRGILTCAHICCVSSLWRGTEGAARYYVCGLSHRQWHGERSNSSIEILQESAMKMYYKNGKGGFLPVLEVTASVGCQELALEAVAYKCVCGPCYGQQHGWGRYN